VIDLVDWDELGMRAALARRDLTEVYRRLKSAGVTQRRIGELTAQSQSEVSEILKGRRVLAYDVLVRVADGLGIPRGRMGLTYDLTSIQFAPHAQVNDEHTTRIEEMGEAVKRRLLLASATMALVDRPVLGAVAAPDHAPVATPLPTRIVKADVTALHALTEQLRALGRAGHSGMPEVLAPIAHRADQLLTVPATDNVRQALLSQLAELHTLTGWCCTDMLQINQARHHYNQALHRAADAGDVLRMVSAATHAAHMDRELGAPNDALKLYQMAQAKLLDVRGPELPALHAALHIRSAYSWALLDRPDHAREQLARVADLPAPADPYERADSDGVRARTELILGRLDAAEQLATRAIRTWSPNDRRDSAYARITLATTYTIAGEPAAPALAAAALDMVAALPSALARADLAPLENALADRKDSASVELAQQARALRAA